MGDALFRSLLIAAFGVFGAAAAPRWAAEGAGNPAPVLTSISLEAGGWVKVVGPIEARAGHVALTLADGRVMVAGGQIANDGNSHVELFSPTSGSWSSTAAYFSNRTGHTMNLLPGGRVLVAGTLELTFTYAQVFVPATDALTFLGAQLPAFGKHAAVEMANGQVLTTGGVGSTIAPPLTTCRLFTFPGATWAATGGLNVGRHSHTATRLPDGRVLVIGGITGGVGNTSVLASCELYDPTAGSWSLTGSLAQGRSAHTATLLPDGRVLVAGGSDAAGAPLAGCELFDPAAGTWTATGGLQAARSGPTATMLPHGAVLLVGGRGADGLALASTELYHAASGQFTPGAPLLVPRAGHTASLLPGGDVLVVAGAPGVAHAEILGRRMARAGRTISLSFTANEAIQTPVVVLAGRAATVTHLGGTHWLATVVVEPTDPQGPAAFSITATDLDGNVSVVTSTTDGTVAIIDSTPPETSITSGTPPNATSATFTFAGSDQASGVVGFEVSFDGADYLPVPGTLTLDPISQGAHVLRVRAVDLAGNADPTPAEVAWVVDTLPAVLRPVTFTDGAVDPRNGTWTTTADPNLPLFGHTATLLSNGRVLLAGGARTAGSTEPAEIYDPVRATWAPAADLPIRIGGHTATLLEDGQVLVAGGAIFLPPSSQSLLYDVAANIWKATGSPALSRQNHSATRLPDGRVLVVGGSVNLSTGIDLDSGTAELFDPLTQQWSPAASLNVGRRGHAAALLADGRVLVVASGGYSSGPTLTSAEIYDPAANTWTMTGSLAVARFNPTATRLASGKVLVVGGRTANAELYDPANGQWSPTGSMSEERHSHTATLLPDGRVLVAGGFRTGSPPFTGSPALDSAEIYDPVSGTWTGTGRLDLARGLQTATLLPNGQVLTFGGIINGDALTPIPVPGAVLFRPGPLSYYRAGQVLTVRYTADEFITTSAELAGRPASLESGPGNAWIARITVLPGDPQGVAVLRLSSTDNFGNSAVVTSPTDASAAIIDTLAPVVTPPPDVVVHATDPTGGPASYASASAHDVNGIVSLLYDRSSGSHFPVGVTTVFVSATDPAGNIGTATFTVTVTPLTALEAWRYQHFGSATGGGSFANTADFDRDGRANLLEFAFGTDPAAGSDGPLQFGGTFAQGALLAPGLPISRAEGTDVRALFIRRADHAALGLSYAVLFSADLAAWQESAAPPVVLATNGAHEVTSVPFPPGARFVRVQVSLPR